MRPVPGTITDPAVDRQLGVRPKRRIVIELTADELEAARIGLQLAPSGGLLYPPEIAALGKVLDALS